MPRRLLVASLSLAVIAACGSAPPRPDPPPRPRADPQETELSGGAEAPADLVPDPKGGILADGQADKILKVGAPSIVRLMEPGREPRAPLRYAPKTGPAVKVVTKLGIDASVKVQAAAVPQGSIPTMRIGFEVATEAAKDPGNWTLRGKVAAFDFEGVTDAQKPAVAELRKALGGLTDFRFSAAVDARGRAHDFKGEPDASLLAESLESLVVPLPDEPIGAGGKWQVTSRIRSGGSDLLRSATYTLATRDGDKATLDVAIRDVAASSDLTPPGLGQQVKASAKGFSSSGKGQATIDLDSAIVRASKVQSRTEIAMKLQTLEDTVEATSTVLTSLAIER